MLYSNWTVVHFRKEAFIKKDLIIKHSIEILSTKGYFNTTTRMIAKKSGIAVGTIYTYFKNKEAIIDEIFQMEFHKRTEYLEKLNQKNISSIEKFHQFLDFHFDLLVKDPALSKVLIQESTNPELQTIEGIQKFIQQLPGFFQKILDEGIKKGEIRSLDSSITAYIIFGNIRGIVLNTELSKSEFAIQKVKEELKDYITYALKEA